MRNTCAWMGDSRRMSGLMTSCSVVMVLEMAVALLHFTLIRGTALWPWPTRQAKTKRATRKRTAEGEAEGDGDSMAAWCR